VKPHQRWPRRTHRVHLRHGHRFSAVLPSDPAAVAVLRLAALALLVALLLWVAR
jgi:hypothetical protein